MAISPMTWYCRLCLPIDEGIKCQESRLWESSLAFCELIRACGHCLSESNRRFHRESPSFLFFSFLLSFSLSLRFLTRRIAVYCNVFLTRTVQQTHAKPWPKKSSSNYFYFFKLWDVCVTYIRCPEGRNDRFTLRWLRYFCNIVWKQENLLLFSLSLFLWRWLSILFESFFALYSTQ